MKKLLFTLGLLITLATVSYSNDNEAIFKIAKEKIDPIIATLKPKAIIELKNENTLIISYRKRKFTIHGTSMIGKHSDKPYETDGPDYKGFILTLYVQTTGTINQAITPQILKRPYWSTYLNVTPIRSTKKQFFWSLSYGRRTDKKLLEKIKKAILKL